MLFRSKRYNWWSPAKLCDNISFKWLQFVGYVLSGLNASASKIFRNV